MNWKYTVLSKPGKRTTNEDSIFPTSDLENSDLFLVCDGVGGAAKGEIASWTTCNAIAAYFKGNVRNGNLSEDTIQAAVQEASVRLQDHVKGTPLDRDLSTTLTLLYLENEEAWVAHIGDSRVCHIRNGRILFQTHDHSFVNDLVAAGLITDTEASTHPKRNVISRVISAAKERTTADIHRIRLLQHGDYFLLASDGIFEAIDEHFINENFRSTDVSIKDIMRKIDNVCSQRSNDNYSAIIVQIFK